MHWKDVIIGGLLVGFGFGIGVLHEAYVPWSGGYRSWNPNGITARLVSGVETNTDFTQGCNQAIHSVVTIRCIKKKGKESSGSGVIIKKEGFIVTNYHVIKDYEQIEVELPNGTRALAKLQGIDAYTDLAVLIIQVPFELKPIKFSNSDDVRIGEWVLAIGSPYNLQGTVTKGIISGVGREIGVLKNQIEDQVFSDLVIESFLQTDAPINPGNSGGALVNIHGELIGINTAIASESGFHEGFGFAIPSNLVYKITQDLIQYGKAQRGFLGISTQAPKNPFFFKKNPDTGLEVAFVELQSPAFHAGLMEGDIILEVNGCKVKNSADFKQKIACCKPLDTLELKIFRNDKVITIFVQLKELSI